MDGDFNAAAATATAAVLWPLNEFPRKEEKKNQFQFY
jgi:hypothetical protein